MKLHLTREQVRRIDELATTRFGIAGLVLMENAGRNAAAIVDREYGPRGSALVLCGTGNNGGDGCVIARHLANAGWRLRLLVAGDESRMTSDAVTNFRIVRAMNIDNRATADAEVQLDFLNGAAPDDVLVDALLGTGFRGDVRSPMDQLIAAANGSPKRGMVAIDVPSGLDCNTGTSGPATIRADMTVTFVAPKVGFQQSCAAPFVGRIHVADIGAPACIIRELGLDV